MKKILGFVLVLLMVIVTACSGANKDQKPAAQNSADTGDQAKAANSLEGTKITFVATSSRKTEVLNSLIKEFEDKTKIKVELVTFPENEMYDKVKLAAASGNVPYDVWSTGAGGAKQYGQMGILEPLEAPKDYADFFPGDVKQYQVGDKIYGIPWASDINLLYYRTDLLKAAGFTDDKGNAKPPSTWDEFRDMAKKLTVDENGKHLGEPGFDSNKVAVYGALFKGANALASSWEFWNYLYSFGGSAVSIDESKKAYSVEINKEPAVKALQFIVDNYKDGIYPKGVPNFDYNEFFTMFLQGKAALAINWPNLVGMAKDPKQSQIVDKFSVGLMPKGIKNAGEIGGSSLHILKSSKNKKAARMFIDYLTSQDTMTSYAKSAVGTTPARKSSMKQLIDEAQGIDKVRLQAVSDNLNNGQMVDLVATGESWMDTDREVQSAIQSALTQKESVQSALDKAAANIDKILKKNKFMQN
ncbi:ABC transporter substrate-binding protein [Paenibacillus piri]|uniref:Sugar ABC transporter substrate-binding protein n=1 Tax=Paenibacillus piri TaxID=2547395 RepID=A0A4R5K718_9BACL|nr:sugar ABC transporter substrate-binding protein [Paenibacillus piri]TDF89439.1 sugar ABC transporter substrate-binding protein [Paenibacillus piri]